MRNMGWVSIDKDLDLADIVNNIKAKDDNGIYLWKYLKCTKSDTTFTRTEFNMCSTYKNYYKTEILEFSNDNKHWKSVAKRDLKVGSRCLYAD